MQKRLIKLTRKSSQPHLPPIQEDTNASASTHLEQSEEERDEAAYLKFLEKLISNLFEYYNKTSLKRHQLRYYSEVESYLEIMNKKCVNAFNSKNIQAAVKINTKVLDIFHNKYASYLFESGEKMNEHRVLGFNNLSCISRNMKSYRDAVNAANIAVDLEEKLIQNKHETSNISIITTYINRSAIFSEMGDHTSALNDALKALTYIDKLTEHPNLTDQEQREHLQSSMLAFYLVGVEHEYLRNNSDAIENYQRVQEIAKVLDKHDIVAKMTRMIHNIQSRERLITK